MVKRTKRPAKKAGAAATAGPGYALLDLPEPVRARILAGVEDGRISADLLWELSGDRAVEGEVDPAEIAALESKLSAVGIEVTDGDDEAAAEPIEEKREVRHSEPEALQLYIQEIGRTPLIPGEREVELGKIIQERLAEIRELEATTGLALAELRRYFPDPAAPPPPPLKGHDRRRLAKQATALVEAESAFAEAQRILIESNLRLVVSIAKRYAFHGMQLLDLINEGNLGLIRAVERFDYRRGFKFSTYASWWIRQSIRRALADQARMIRVPVHVADAISRWIKATRSLSQRLGREPNRTELAAEMKIPEPKLIEIIKVSQEPSSLEAPLASAQDSTLAELIEDTGAASPYKTVLSLIFLERIRDLLATLQEKERAILECRFGLNGREEMTLEVVGAELGITRERVRQLEMRALKKLRNSKIAEELYGMMAEIEL
jgi:RNA polymerase primary sigma factor